MMFVKKSFAQWGITAKLTTLFVLFGFVPMAVVGLIAYNASLTIEGSVGTRFQSVAEGVADKIDRNLFERYGDVQAFGFNRVLDQKAAWYRADVEDNPIRQVIDQYVDTYDLYSLSILVDLDGRVIAVNSKDADGKPIHSRDLYGKNYRETPWFRALKAEQFTTTMPFSAPGNMSATGTYIEDLHVDSDVKAAYPGDDGLTLGFSAPVYRDGKVVAYWSNRAKFSVVEDILRTTQQVMRNAGFLNSAVALLDKDGKILVDYDPVDAGTDQFRHDFTTLMTDNWADRGITAAKEAVAGKTGFAKDLHHHTEILQTVGYTHLKGALGYPGMNWSVLVSVDHATATADARSINQKVLIAIIVCLVIILLIGSIIGRIGIRGISQVSEAAAKMAGGALDTRVSVTNMDEIGTLAQSFNEMGDKLQANMMKEREQAAKTGQFMVDAKRVLGNLAQGDLTDQMTSACEGDLEQIKVSLNSAITNLTTTLTTVRGAADRVAMGAEEITKGSEDLSQRTSEQASALEETSASMEEMTSTVKQNADNAKQANQLAIAARDIADKSGAITTKAVEAMGEINKSSKKIADIITVIDEIAFQTNLLALNAAVEAARAGEHGRGFAVVAAEVRNLAQRSASAAKEIKGLINESIQRVTDGSELVNQSGKTLGEIVNSVKRVTDIIAEISTASQEQASGLDQVHKAIMQMDETTQQNAALVEETTSASQSMKDQARELMRQVEVFKTNGAGEASHVKREASDSALKYVARTALHATPKPMGKKPVGGAKSQEDTAPVGVAAGNGKDRRQKEAEFEEF
ncbi:MAG: HAMP domain-containing protein [Nitrospiraceae bacterium]|nr:HAMP domain-containing protein [Nitrospiraceae bacterium]